MCGDIIDKISLYIDNQLSVEEDNELKKHLNECETCRKEFFAFTDMMNEVKTISQKELPENFHMELMKKIENSEQLKSKERLIEHNTKTKFKPADFIKNQKWRKYTLVAASVLTMLVVVTVASIALTNSGKSASSMENTSSQATSARGYSSGAVYGEAKFELGNINEEMNIAYDTAAMEEAETSAAAPAENQSALSTGSQESAGVNRKIIKNSYISLEADSFDQVTQTLKTITEQSGGYVESFQSYSNGTYVYNDQTVELKGGSIVLRIPSAKYDSVTALVGTLGKIISQNESSENVTAQYIDTEARLKVKQEEENRLMALIEKANKIDDIITLESRLSEIRSTIESYQSTLKNFDSLVQFSTINININEKAPTAVRYEPDKSFDDRVREGVMYSLNSAQAGFENFLIGAARNMVGLIIFFVLLVILLVVAYKKIIPKTRGKQ